jgi:hypothetical protein
VHGVAAEPVYVTDAGHDTEAVVAAPVIWNDVALALPSQLVPPAYVAVTLTVPALTFGEYDTATGVLSPPTPVAVAVHGVCAAPVYATDAGQLMVVVDGAAVIWKFAAPLLD